MTRQRINDAFAGYAREDGLLLAASNLSCRDWSRLKYVRFEQRKDVACQCMDSPVNLSTWMWLYKALEAVA